MNDVVRRVVRRLGSARGQSETIGVVLLLALTIIGAGAVVGFGAATLDDAKQRASTGSAEHAMTQFDSRASLIAHGDTNAQTVRFAGARDAKRTVESDRGWMNVTIVNQTTGDVQTNVMNVTLGAVSYEDGETTIAYQGGGVWRSTGDGSVMLSPPEFHYRESTLTLPLVLVRGDGTLDERARITRGGPTRAKYPNVTMGRTNPLTAGKVNVTVHSRYYQAWGRFFRQRTDGSVAYDHASETATATLITPASLNPIQYGVTGSSAGDEIQLSGSGSNEAFVDSYNSSSGNYSSTKSENGTLSMAGSVTVGGNGRIKGDVRSGEAVTLKGGSNVTGTVFYTTGKDIKPNAEYGGLEKIDGVGSTDSVDPLVNERLVALSSSNDNGATSAINSGDRLNFSGGSTVTLPDGEYYLEKIDMASSEKLVIDTNGSQTKIAVGNSVSLDDTANITVKGGGTVRIYVDDDIDMQKRTSVYVPDDNSRQMWFYGTRDATIDLQGDNSDPIKFVGVIYAPSAGSDVTVKHANVYGGVIAGKVTIGTGGAVHFDQNLQTVSPIPGAGSIPQLTYLHISANPVNVTAG